MVLLLSVSLFVMKPKNFVVFVRFALTRWPVMLALCEHPLWPIINSFVVDVLLFVRFFFFSTCCVIVCCASHSCFVLVSSYRCPFRHLIGYCLRQLGWFRLPYLFHIPSASCVRCFFRSHLACFPSRNLGFATFRFSLVCVSSCRVRFYQSGSVLIGWLLCNCLL